MSTATPADVAIPLSGFQAASTANTQDGNNGAHTPHVHPASPNSSLTIEPAYAPTYPRGSALHRAGSLIGAVLAAADTSDPSAVPTWIGQVASAYTSGGTSLVVTPYGNYGQPATGQSYILSTANGGTTCVSFSSTAVSGGAGSPYTLTVPSLGHNYAVGDYVVVMASGGVSTNTTSSVPSGAVGGPGSNWVDFYVAVTASTTSGTTSGTVMPRIWNPRTQTWFDSSVSAPSFSAATSINARLMLARIETHGQWVYCAVPALTLGTGGTPGVTIDAVVV